MDFIKQDTIDKLSLKIREYYHKEGYNGLFGETAHFEYDSSGNLVLVGPEYSYYTLFGRKPGRVPPILPIIEWTKRYNINANPWSIRFNIGKNGTNGNNFIEKNKDNFLQYTTELLVNDLQEKLNYEIENSKKK